MKKAILFDLDGTILNSKPGIFHSVAYALEKLEHPMPTEAELMEFLGPPLSVGFASVCHVSDHQIADAVRLYREYYNAGGMFESEIYNGLPELLKALQLQGKLCYITTSKPHVFAKQILEHFEIAGCFNDIFGSELDGTRGHKSEVVSYCLETHGLTADEVILVGDRHFDVNGAKALGMDCIGVLYGYGSEAELKEAGAYRIAQSVEELQTLLLDI